MSSLGRTLQNNDIACPNCGGKRCSIHWEGGACANCDGSGNWKGRGPNTCRRCDSGKKKAWVKCFRGGKGYDLDASVVVNRPALKPSSPRATDARVDLIYTAFLSRCHLTDDWREHLRKERSLSDGTIEQSGFVTLPKQETCNRIAAEIAGSSLGSPVGVPGFYEHEGQWHFRRTLRPWEFGLVIPYRNIIGQIVMLQIRSASKIAQSRYLCISGAPLYVSHAGTSSGAPAHWVAGPDASVIGITEGGLKAIAIDNHWRSLSLPPMRWVGLCGLSVPGGFVTDMRAKLPKATKLILAFDREVKDSPAWQSVERVKATLRDAAAKWGLSVVEVGGWPEGSAAKFDDYLRGLF